MGAGGHRSLGWFLGTHFGDAGDCYESAHVLCVVQEMPRKKAWLAGAQRGSWVSP